MKEAGELPPPGCWCLIDDRGWKRAFIVGPSSTPGSIVCETDSVIVYMTDDVEKFKPLPSLEAQLVEAIRVLWGEGVDDEESLVRAALNKKGFKLVREGK